GALVGEHRAKGKKATLPKEQRPPFPNSLARLTAELHLAECAQRECENLPRPAPGRPAQNHIRGLSALARESNAHSQPNRLCRGRGSICSGLRREMRPERLPKATLE